VLAHDVQRDAVVRDRPAGGRAQGGGDLRRGQRVAGDLELVADVVVRVLESQRDEPGDVLDRDEVDGQIGRVRDGELIREPEPCGDEVGHERRRSQDRRRDRAGPRRLLEVPLGERAIPGLRRGAAGRQVDQVLEARRLRRAQHGAAPLDLARVGRLHADRAVGADHRGRHRGRVVQVPHRDLGPLVGQVPRSGGVPDQCPHPPSLGQQAPGGRATLPAGRSRHQHGAALLVHRHPSRPRAAPAAGPGHRRCNDCIFAMTAERQPMQ
jgi:hypothetical protein